MNIDVDKTTALLYKSIDILFLKNPEKTAFGVLLGVFLVGIKDAVGDLIGGNIGEAVKSVNMLATFVFGILLVRIDVIFKREPINKEVSEKLNSLKKIIDEANFSDAEKRSLYRSLIDEVYKDYKVKESTKEIKE